MTHILYLGSVEDILDRQHGDNSQDLVTTGKMDRHDQHLGQHGLQRKLSHLKPE